LIIKNENERLIYKHAILSVFPRGKKGMDESPR
jgi:sRNA-binding regulator protein Hfq